MARPHAGVVVLVLAAALPLASTSSPAIALSWLRMDPVRMLGVLNQLTGDLCRNNTQLLLKAAANHTTWASQMLDASAKSASDLLDGNQYVLGSFDECLSAAAPDGNPRGQYCLATVRLSDTTVTSTSTSTTATHTGRAAARQLQDASFQPLWPSRYQAPDGRFWTVRAPEQWVRWGACLPASCSVRDAQLLLGAAIHLEIEDPGATLKLSVEIPERSCQDGGDKPWSGLELMVIGVFMGFVSLLLVATTYDVCLRQDSDGEQKGMLSAVLVSFSVRGNVLKLLRWSPSELGLDCVLGIKFYCMLLVTAGHGVVFLISGPITNTEYVSQAVTQPQHSYLLNGMLLVDSFLVVSGFLLTRLLMLELDRRRSVNFGLLYLFRYIRLTPSYLAMVALYATVLPRLGSGPLWPARILLEQDRCRASWWANALYINNYVHPDQLCMFQSWYISADTQLFMLAPLVVYPLWRWPTMGRLLAALATLAAILTPFAVTWSQRLDPVLLIFPKEIWHGDLSGNVMYQTAIIKTHMRASSYFCGLLLGWFVHRFQAADRHMSKRTVWLGWTAATLVGVSCMFSVSVFYQPGYMYSALEAALYASLHRLGWCSATAWLIFACVTGNGGLMQRALTWRPLVPLSRLTYCAYLVNGVVVLLSVANVRQPRTLSTLTLAMEVSSQVMVTFLGALVLSLMLESPVHGLERALLTRYGGNEQKHTSKEIEEAKSPSNHSNLNNETQTSSQL